MSLGAEDVQPGQRGRTLGRGWERLPERGRFLDKPPRFPQLLPCHPSRLVPVPLIRPIRLAQPRELNVTELSQQRGIARLEVCQDTVDIESEDQSFTSFM